MSIAILLLLHHRTVPHTLMSCLPPLLTPVTAAIARSAVANAATTSATTPRCGYSDEGQACRIYHLCQCHADNCKHRDNDFSPRTGSVSTAIINKLLCTMSIPASTKAFSPSICSAPVSCCIDFKIWRYLQTSRRSQMLDSHVKCFKSHAF